MSIFKKLGNTSVQTTSSGIYMDIVKRPVRNRPVALSVLRANAKREKRNEEARQKRLAQRQLRELTIAVKN